MKRRKKERKRCKNKYNSFCLYEYILPCRDITNSFRLGFSLSLSLWGSNNIYFGRVGIVHGSSLQDFFFFFFFLFYEILFFFCIFNSVGLQEREKETSPFASLFRGLFVFIFISFFSLCASFKKTTNWNVGQVASIFFFFFFEKCFFFVWILNFIPPFSLEPLDLSCVRVTPLFILSSRHTHTSSPHPPAHNQKSRVNLLNAVTLFIFSRSFEKKIKIKFRYRHRPIVNPMKMAKMFLLIRNPKCFYTRTCLQEFKKR